jgi:hypothetical protein
VFFYNPMCQFVRSHVLPWQIRRLYVGTLTPLSSIVSRMLVRRAEIILSHSHGIEANADLFFTSEG